MPQQEKERDQGLQQEKEHDQEPQQEKDHDQEPSYDQRSCKEWSSLAGRSVVSSVQRDHSAD